MNWKNLLIKTTKTIKSFSYNKGSIRMNFSVNIEDKKELSNYRECLADAIKDADKELFKHK